LWFLGKILTLQQNTQLIMTTITIQYDENNRVFAQLIAAFRTLGATISRPKRKVEETSMTKEELDAKIKSAQQQHEEGSCKSFSDKETLNEYLLSL